MKKVKIITIILAIIAITLVAFGGVYIQTQNRMENKVKDYQLGKELEGERVIELKITSDSDDSENTETSEETDGTTEENTENAEATDSTAEEAESEQTTVIDAETLEKCKTVKKTIENRLKALGSQDYTISLNEQDGTIRVELPEDDSVDSYAYFLYATLNIDVKDEETEEELISDSMIKKATYSYGSDNSGAYQVYLELELNKDGQAKLKEIQNNYAILSTEVQEIEDAKEDEEESTDESSQGSETETSAEGKTTETETPAEGETAETETPTEGESSENTTTDGEEAQNNTTENESTENTEPTKKIAKLYIDGTEFDVDRIEGNKIRVMMGSKTSNTTNLNNYLAQAAEISMMENSGKYPISYEIVTNRYEFSNITKTDLMYFAIAIAIILLVILLVYCIIYKSAGILASFSFIGFVAIFSLLLRYTNVAISIEGIAAIIITILLNLKLNQELLSRTKKINMVKEAMKATYKNIFLMIIPIMILTIVFCFAKWSSLNSFGLIMFWGIILDAIYNYIVTRTLLMLREK